MSNPSIQFEHWYRVDLLEGVTENWIPGGIFTQDKTGNVIGVKVYRGMDPVDLDAATITGNVFLPDGTTILGIEGYKSGNLAWIYLPDNAYTNVGQIGIIIRAQKLGSKTVLACIHATVNATTTETQAYPEQMVSDISDLIRRAEALQILDHTEEILQAAADAKDAEDNVALMQADVAQRQAQVQQMNQEHMQQAQEKLTQILSVTTTADALSAEALTKATNAENALAEANGIIDDLTREVETLRAEAEDAIYDHREENGVLYLLNKNGEVVGSGISGIGGGGGGGGGSITNAVMTASKLENWASKTITKGAQCMASITWSSLEDEVPTGNGTLTVSVSGNTRLSMDVTQGEVSVDLARYATGSSNSMSVTITDAYGQSRTFRYTVVIVDLVISSSFDTSVYYQGPIPFQCTMSGQVKSRELHIELDGTELEPVTIPYKQYSVTIPAQSHGAHVLRVWFVAEVNGTDVQSNVLYYEFMSRVAGNTTPIITSNFSVTSADQYATVSIPYRVWSPVLENVPIHIYVNNVEAASLTVNADQQVFNYKAMTAGSTTVKIAVSENVYKELTFTVNEVSIDVQPVAQDLVLRLSPEGRSNNEVHPNTWTYGNISAQFVGFNWIRDGWQKDNDGYDVLRLSGDARLTIPYNLFGDDFKAKGKTIEIEFATREVRDYSANLVSCYDGSIGLKITPQTIQVSGAQTTLSTQYKDGEHIRLSITVDKQTDNRLIFIYIDGIRSRCTQYASGERFSQLSPVPISIGSSDCGIDIYGIRVYDNNLTDDQIVDNWIADTQSGEVMVERYQRNNVCNDNDEITIETLGSSVPYMVIESPSLPDFKGDKKTVSGRFVDPYDSSRSFSFDGCEIDVQGTSSSVYYVKNIDMKFKNGFVTTGGSTINKYALRPGSIPFNRFVLKADVASSESANNTMLAMFYNDSCPYKIPEMLENTKVRWGIEGVPIVMFWTNSDTGITKFMGKYNFNLPKRCAGPLGYSGNDESWEWQRNNSANVKFQDDDFSTMYYDPINDERYPAWYDDFEARFPDDTWRDITQLQAFLSFVKSTDRNAATNEDLAESVTYHVPTLSMTDKYPNDQSYTIVPETDGNGVATGLYAITFTKDTPAYRLTKFRAELSKYVELQSACYYYLHTDFLLMIDSWAKNMFVGFHGSQNSDQNIPLQRKVVFEPYDMDTAIGTDNSGSLVYGYWWENTDHMDKAVSGGSAESPIHNAQDSVMWCNLRDAFRSEIVSMYRSLRTGNNPAWSYERLKGLYDTHQSAWCERVVNKDAYVKYITPLVEAVTKNPDTGRMETTNRYLPMLQGMKRSQRDYWLYNRFRYMDAMYLTGEATSRTLDLRLSGSGRLEITSAVPTYIAVRFGLGSTPVMQRVDANQKAYFDYTTPAGVKDMETSIYSADLITDVGDLSVFKPDELQFSKGTRLKNLKVGDSAQNYENEELTDLQVKNSVLLETIDCRNCPNLAITVDLENSPKLRAAYFDNTSITGVELADGGELQTLHLPDTVTALTLMNLKKLNEFVLSDYSHISRLMLSNIPTSVINPVTVLREIAPNSLVYIQGLYLELANTDAIDEFLTLLGTMRGVTREKNADGTWLYHEYDDAQIFGEVHTGSLTGDQIATYNLLYPYLRFTADHVSCTLNYYNYEGDTLLHSETVLDGGDGTWVTQPTHDATPANTFSFAGWAREPYSSTADATARTGVTANRNVYAAYTLTGRTYTVYFYDDKNAEIVSQRKTGIPYGGSAIFTGTTPTYTTDPDNYVFNGWDPAPTNIHGDTRCYPTWRYTGSVTRGLIDRSIKSYSDDVVTTVRSSAFNNCSQLTSIDLPEVTSIGSSAFYSCSQLVSINLPKVTSIGAYAFNNCNSIANVNLPKATSIGSNAFNNCYQLKSIDLPEVTSIGDNAFYYCSQLTSIDLPEVTSISDGAFKYCSRLRSISNLKVTSIKNNIFDGCSELISVDLQNVTSIGKYAFSNCNKLISVIIRTTTAVCTLSNTNALNNAANAIIYVPDDKVNNYKTATNWSTYADRIKGLSELPSS